jgi:hypothetical protein
MSLVRDTEAAFHFVIDLLEQHRIEYKITGGFAARLYGANRELADIDIEVKETDLPLLASLVADYTTYPLQRYQDDNWDLMLLTVNYRGQEIDLASQTAKIFNQQTVQWEVRTSELTNYELHTVYGREVKVETRTALVVYKLKLARAVDVDDVYALSVASQNTDGEEG